MKKNIIILVAVLAVLAAGGGYWALNQPKEPTPNNSVCSVGEMTFYYLPQCTWCNKLKGEGTITALEELGVKVIMIDASKGPIKHKFSAVPTVAIQDKVYEGYQTLDQLKTLLGCPITESVSASSSDAIENATGSAPN